MSHRSTPAPPALTLDRVDSSFEREPLLRPFGFKGGYMREIWQTAVLLEAGGGRPVVGLGTQNVLWSDARVFAATSEAAGNALMYAVTDRALQLAKEASFTDPLDLQQQILPEVHRYAARITGRSDLRKTFVLNALVALDNAAWVLYARERGLESFDEVIPAEYRAALAHRQREVASIPIMAYSIPIEEVERALDEGYFFLKLKLGHPGSQREMLAKDVERLELVHRRVGNRTTRHTADGKLPYYLDFNGRYESKETLLELLDAAERIGALERIAIVEEPFPEEYEADVSDVPARIAADESAHTAEDVTARIQMGYTAIALKPVAKTLSMTLKMAQRAHENEIPCFCADLTVNPILVDWNKNVAARLEPVPGFGVGLLETNGHQNYRHWSRLQSFHPCAGAAWTEPRQGVFELDADFYRRSGGIFETSEHYLSLFTTE
jgi:L-alanine-DL-glutamate epimerase-like enolase superfamily enzyme